MENTKNIKLGDKSITIRKWKGKDKRNFVKAIKDPNVTEDKILDSLIYSCIKEDVVLSEQEFRYVMVQIRAFSLGEDISIPFKCPECGHEHTQHFNLSDVIRYKFEPLNNIVTSVTTIKLGDIVNKQTYLEKIVEDPMYDLLLRIKSFNGNDSFTLDELVELFDEMDADEYDHIMETFNSHKFTIDDINEVECTKCSNKTNYSFDEIPGFIPESWLK